MELINATPAQRPVIITDNYEIGRLFEEYIRKLFNENSFQLKKWHKSEKLIDKIYRNNLSDPDMEFHLFGRREYRFAVECKWRSEFKNGVIQWAERHQIMAYNDFQKSTRMPVFIAIGVGGEPSNPERLFVTPLHMISNSHFALKSDLLKHIRKPTRRFFYDYQQMSLF